MFTQTNKSNPLKLNNRIHIGYAVFFHFIKQTGLCWIFCILLLNGCDESLPPYQKPENLFTIDRIEISQGTHSIAGDYLVKFHIYGKNLFDETFSDRVNIRGSVQIWNKEKPDLSATLSLDNTNFGPDTDLSGNVLTLGPGEEFELRVTWDCHTDDGEDLAGFFNMSPQAIAVVSTGARDFYVQAEVTLFEELGLIRSEPVLFFFNG